MNGLNEAALVLLIVVSSALTVFLIVAIVLGVKLIQIAQSVKRITSKAEKLAESAEAIGEFLKKSARPMALGKSLGNIFESVIKRRKNKEEDD